MGGAGVEPDVYKRQIEASMAKIFEGPAESAAPSGDMGDTRVFDQIQFGKDYEIE